MTCLNRAEKLLQAQEAALGQLLVFCMHVVILTTLFLSLKYRIVMFTVF